MQSVWTPAEVALLLDTPTVIVLRWCALELLPGARQIRGEWAIPGRSLFFVLSEAHRTSLLTQDGGCAHGQAAGDAARLGEAGIDQEGQAGA